ARRCRAGAIRRARPAEERHVVEVGGRDGAAAHGEHAERLPSGPGGPEGTEVRLNGDGDDRPARGLPEVQAVGQPGEAARGDVEAKETVARRLADRNRRVDLVYAETDLELAEPIAADAVGVARIAVDALHAGRPRVPDRR